MGLVDRVRALEERLDAQIEANKRLADALDILLEDGLSLDVRAEAKAVLEAHRATP